MKYIPVCVLALIGLGASAITAQVIYNSAQPPPKALPTA